MRNIWLVIKHELSVTLRRRSFWLVTLLMPALLLGVNAYPAYREAQQAQEAAAEADGTAEEEPEEIPSIGLVDHAGIIQEIPADFPPDYFVPFGDEATARAALDVGDVAQYVVLPTDVLEGGLITVYDREFALLLDGNGMEIGLGGAGEILLRRLIFSNLLDDPQLVGAVDNPTPGVLAEQIALAPPAAQSDSEAEAEALARLVATLLPFLFYIILIVTSGYLLQSVTAEKENRTVEILLLSVEPRQLMTGKLIGLSAVALLQLGIWMGLGSVILDQTASIFDTSAFTFPPGFILWAVLFLVLGFLLFGSIMMAGGALAPTAREGSQMTLALIIPFMPTLIFASEFLDNPHGTLSVALSLIPLTAPSAMITRMAVAEVPLWQIGLSVAGVALTAYLFLSLAARFFRPQNLLQFGAFSWKRLFTAWR